MYYAWTGYPLAPPPPVCSANALAVLRHPRVTLEFLFKFCDVTHLGFFTTLVSKYLDIDSDVETLS